MNALVRSELMKLRTTKLAGILVGAWLVLSAALAWALGTFTGASDLRTVAEQDELLRFSWSIFGVLLMPVVGIGVATADTAHRTLGATLLVEPRRPRVVGAKALAALLIGAGAGVLAGLVAIVVGTITVAVRDLGTDLIVERGLWFVVAATVVGALVTLFGFGVGLLLNSQTAAIVITVAFFLVIEGVLSLLLVLASAGDVVAVLPGSLAGQVGLLGAEGAEIDSGFDDVDLLSPPIAAIVLALWGALLTLAGGLRLERADVT